MQDFFLRLISKAKGTPEEAGQAPEVRVAVYDSLLSPPQIVSLSAEDFNELVGELASRTHAFARERGGWLCGCACLRRCVWGCAAGGEHR